MSNSPYIEVKGQTYEFEANWKLRREYNKEMQSLLLKSQTKLTAKDLEDFKEVEQFVKDNPNLTPEDILNLDEDKKAKLVSVLNLGDSLTNNTDLYEKYCFKMLNEKYFLTKEQFDNLLSDFSEEYGLDKLDMFLQKVCEKVFTPAVESNNKKPLPEWVD